MDAFRICIGWCFTLSSTSLGCWWLLPIGEQTVYCRLGVGWCGRFLGSEMVLSPVVSRRLPLSPFMWGVGVGWCGHRLGLLSPVVSRCPSPFMWGLGVGWCGRLLGLWSGLVSRWPLCPFVSLHVGGGGCFYFCVYSMVESNISTMFGCI